MQFVKNCKTSSIILCMYMIPIFIFGTYYRDDNGRVVSQYFDWDLDGRPLTDVIIKFLNFGGRLTDIAPMSQLIAIIISSITCGIICSFIVKSNKLSVIISSTMLFISPFYIQNLLYRFDVVTMALSILFAAVPFLINCKIKSYIHAIVSFVSITCLLTTYQASLPVFYSFILISFLTSDDLKNNIIRVFSGLSSLVVYYFVISPMYVGGGYAKYRAESIDTSSGSIIDTISSNIYTLLKTAHILIDFKFILVFSLLIAMALLKLAILIKNKKINYKNTTFSLFFLCAFASSFIIFFLLKKPVYEPRVMIGINAGIMIICLIASRQNGGFLDKLSLVAILPPVLFFFSIATNYINANKSYIEYEKNVMQIMHADYMSIGDGKKAYIYGYLNPPYIADQVLQKIPFLRGVIGSRIGPLTNYMSKSTYPLFKFEGYYSGDIDATYCDKVTKQYNGIYSVISDNDTIIFSLKKIECK